MPHQLSSSPFPTFLGKVPSLSLDVSVPEHAESCPQVDHGLVGASPKSGRYFLYSMDFSCGANQP